MALGYAHEFTPSRYHEQPSSIENRKSKIENLKLLKFTPFTLALLSLAPLMYTLVVVLITNLFEILLDCRIDFSGFGDKTCMLFGMNVYPFIQGLYSASGLGVLVTLYSSPLALIGLIVAFFWWLYR